MFYACTPSAKPSPIVRRWLAGDVVETGDYYLGTVLNKAARVAPMAVADVIRVSDVARIMVGDARDFGFGDPASVALKGLEGEQVIYRLEWQT